MAMVTYKKLYNILREKILDKELLPDSKFPPERELCEEYGVSRITVRHALMLLQEQGFIERMQGRGTFVRAAKPQKAAIMDYAYSQSMKQQVPDIERVLITNETVVPPVEIAEALNLFKNEECRFLERLDKTGEEHLSFDQVYIPLAYSKKLRPEILTRVDFLDAWEKAESIRGSFIRETIEAVIANDIVVQRLNVPLGSPILKGTELVFDKEEQPLAVFISMYRHDKFKMVSTYPRNNS